MRLSNFEGELLEEYATYDLLVAIAFPVEKPSNIFDLPAAPQIGQFEKRARDR